MEKVEWKVEGMTCANCALSVNRTLTKMGMQNVAVNVITGDVSFEVVEGGNSIQEVQKQVENLGYHVIQESAKAVAGEIQHHKPKLSKYLLRFWICLPFTLILMLHMLPGLHLHFLMNPWVQFGLALPVFVIGMEFFGLSGLRSIRSGVPNMNVLIALGSLAAFAYSTYGIFTPNPAEYMFFETAASIITIVFFGNWIEDVSVARTQREIKKLTKEHKVTAHMIAYDEHHHEHIFPVDNSALKTGDLILIRSGEQVPSDCKILTGDAEVNEAIITGESIPVFKTKGEQLIGGSVIANGNVKAYVTAVGKDTVMSSITAMMKKAQTEKPPVQQLADRISAIFIPAVLVVALVTFLINLFIADHSIRESLMRSIAVLVIACPCAMGLATPAAIAVGLGRAARHGILYTDVHRMELFRKVQQIVFDKTGTLTTGKFVVGEYKSFEEDEEVFRNLVFSIEKFSNHPIARSIAQTWKTKEMVRFAKVEEIKGEGMRALTKEGIEYRIGSKKILENPPAELHHLYVTKNGQLIGWIDIADEIRPEAKGVIDYCKSRKIKSILLSGDSYEKCQSVAHALGIDEVHAEKTPAEKLALIDAMANAKPTVMVGDGINDAPALAKATISVSLAEASQLAIQSASVVLTSKGLQHLPEAMQLGKLTYGTVKSNLFWAFFYNIVAIPVAAVGLLHPTFGALVMGGSDVVLALNSLWLGVRKIR